MSEKSFELELTEYQKSKKNMLLVILGLGLLGGSTALFTEGWMIILPICLVLGVMMYQKRIGDLKAELIKSAFEQICKDVGASYSGKMLDNQTCEKSLFFPPYINSFYLNSDLPRLVGQCLHANHTLKFSILSFGEVFAKIVRQKGKYITVRSGADGRTTSRISAEGFFFCCETPYLASENWLFLADKWGKHLEKTILKNAIGMSFHKTSQPPFELVKNTDNSTWVYGSNPKAPEDKLKFWEERYSQLQKYPFSMLSVVDNSIYVFIPFAWNISPKKMKESIDECKKRIEFAMDLLFKDVWAQQVIRQVSRMEE